MTVFDSYLCNEFIVKQMQTVMQHLNSSFDSTQQKHNSTRKVFVIFAGNITYIFTSRDNAQKA